MAPTLDKQKKNKNEAQSCAEFLHLFQWFEAQFIPLIQEASEKFWNYTPELKLFSVEKNSKFFMKQNNYFVTQAEINKIKCGIRLSETACQLYFDTILGERKINKPLDLVNMTELEANLICKFNNFIFKQIKTLFIDKDKIHKLSQRDGYFDEVLNLGFILFNKYNPKIQIGKLILSIPIKLINIPQINILEDEKIDILQFKKAQTTIDIEIGSTKLSLDDINNIDIEDIVILENSNLKKMSVKSPCEINFRVSPDPRLIIKADESEDGGGFEVSNKNIWDNIQVDVTAQFNQIKMTLGDLRQMTEGIVIELDSVYENEVTLEVEEKTVAKGELVIVGDKYGVKITKIYETTPEEKTPQAVSAPNEYEEPQQAYEEEHHEEADEDFDVNDFDIDENDL